MADPLKYKRSGLPHRTARDRARAWGAKVPPLPSAQGFCPTHGLVHGDGKCNTAAVDADAEAVSRSGGTSNPPRTLTPFKLGG